MTIKSITSRLKKLSNLVENVYAPGLHLAFALGWFLSLEGFLVLVSERGKSWVLDSKVFLGIVSLFLALFFLRVADEIKDYEYDKVYNPNRPLVCGLVTFNDLYGFLSATGAALILINLSLSRVLALILGLNMMYALFLIRLEKISHRVRESMFLNLLVTYPVNIALSIYIYLFFLIQYSSHPGPADIFILAAFALAFLHYELGRKTCWPHHAPRGKRLYSNVLGGYGSALIALACALAACIIALALMQPWKLSAIKATMGWMLFVPMLPASFGVYRFVKIKARSEPPKPAAFMTPSAMVFLSLFYIVLIIQVTLFTGVSLCF